MCLCAAWLGARSQSIRPRDGSLGVVSEPDQEVVSELQGWDAKQRSRFCGLPGSRSSSQDNWDPERPDPDPDPDPTRHNKKWVPEKLGASSS